MKMGTAQRNEKHKNSKYVDKYNRYFLILKSFWKEFN